MPKGKGWLGGGSGKPGTTEVNIPSDFYLGQYEVTQEEWQKVMGNNPSYFSRTGGGRDAVVNIADDELKRFPVETVSWNDTQEFIKRLNEKDNTPGWLYRLPTDGEWEYACRGGPLADRSEYGFDFYLAESANQLRLDQANFNQVLKRPCKVGSYQPNRLGLYDMHGNMLEWCAEAVGAAHRAVRGGGWSFNPEYCSASHRQGNAASTQNFHVGLRLARVPVGNK